MKNDVLNIISELDKLNRMIKKYTDNYNDRSETFEEIEADRVIEMYQNDLDTMTHHLKVLTWPTESGTLFLNSQGRFEIESGKWWTCGSSMELWVNDEYDPGWQIGHVEHNSKGYYFKSRHGDDVQLMPGMRVRHRVHV